MKIPSSGSSSSDDDLSSISPSKSKFSPLMSAKFGKRHGTRNLKDKNDAKFDAKFDSDDSENSDKPLSSLKKVHPCKGKKKSPRRNDQKNDGAKNESKNETSGDVVEISSNRSENEKEASSDSEMSGQTLVGNEVHHNDKIVKDMVYTDEDVIEVKMMPKTVGCVQEGTLMAVSYHKKAHVAFAKSCNDKVVVGYWGFPPPPEEAAMFNEKPKRFEWKRILKIYHDSVTEQRNAAFDRKQKESLAEAENSRQAYYRESAVADDYDARLRKSISESKRAEKLAMHEEMRKRNNNQLKRAYESLTDSMKPPEKQKGAFSERTSEGSLRELESGDFAKKITPNPKTNPTVTKLPVGLSSKAPRETRRGA